MPNTSSDSPNDKGTENADVIDNTTPPSQPSPQNYGGSEPAPPKSVLTQATDAVEEKIEEPTDSRKTDQPSSAKRFSSISSLSDEKFSIAETTLVSEFQTQISDFSRPTSFASDPVELAPAQAAPFSTTTFSSQQTLAPSLDYQPIDSFPFYEVTTDISVEQEVFDFFDSVIEASFFFPEYAEEFDEITDGMSEADSIRLIEEIIYSVDFDPAAQLDNVDSEDDDYILLEGEAGEEFDISVLDIDGVINWGTGGDITTLPDGLETLILEDDLGTMLPQVDPIAVELEDDPAGLLPVEEPIALELNDDIAAMLPDVEPNPLELSDDLAAILPDVELITLEITDDDPAASLPSVEAVTFEFDDDPAASLPDLSSGLDLGLYADPQAESDDIYEFAATAGSPVIESDPLDSDFDLAAMLDDCEDCEALVVESADGETIDLGESVAYTVADAEVAELMICEGCEAGEIEMIAAEIAIT